MVTEISHSFLPLSRRLQTEPIEDLIGDADEGVGSSSSSIREGKKYAGSRKGLVWKICCRGRRSRFSNEFVSSLVFNPTKGLWERTKDSNDQGRVLRDDGELKGWYGRSGLVVITKGRVGGEVGYYTVEMEAASSWPVVKKNGKGREK
ncbi:unnamed protein product [Lactuca saligna]|uniref:Uncharacterized protein n=1 Tax=Lactuca saligna TaxID=75948 RepID=A0AA35ZDF9_LACSI|nr:unnamed protein product [Lactuca saligna]